MTRDELLALLLSLASPSVDREWAHGEADDALVSYIDDPEITAAYEAVSGA